jgi:NADH:ubiquinone oxidoreductase subunit 6 (subunit J)
VLELFAVFVFGGKEERAGPARGAEEVTLIVVVVVMGMVVVTVVVESANTSENARNMGTDIRSEVAACIFARVYSN